MRNVGDQHGTMSLLVVPLAMATLSCVFTHSVKAREPWDFRLITSPDGGWIDEVEALLEDQSGAVWAATWGGGVCRISASTWDVYQEKDGFVGDWQWGLSQDGAGRVWVSTADGLCRIDGDARTDITMENTPELRDESARRTYVMRNGDLLLGTNKGYIYRCPAAGLGLPHPGPWEQLAGPEETGGWAVNGLVESADGKLWASFKFGPLMQYAGGKWVAQGDLFSTGAYVFGQVDEKIWAANAYGASPCYVYDAGAWAKVGEFPTGVNCFAFSPSRELYAGTDDGLRRLRNGEWQTIDLGAEMGDPNIRAILFSQQGALWIGTQEGLIRGELHSWRGVLQPPGGRKIVRLLAGEAADDPLHGLDAGNNLYRFEGGRWDFATSLQGAENQVIESCTSVRNDAFWARFRGGTTLQIAVDDGAIQRSVPYPPEMSELVEPYSELYEGPGGGLYLHGDTGLYQLEEYGWEPLPPWRDGTGPAPVLSVLETPGEALYVGGHEGVWLWRDGALTMLAAKETQPDLDSCDALLYRRAGAIWIGTRGAGVFQLGDESIQRVSRPEGLRSAFVTSLLQNSDGAVWATYRRQGLGRYQDGQWLNFGYRQGLSVAAVRQLVEHPPGELWASTADGEVFRYRPDTESPRTEIAEAPTEIESHGVATFTFSGWDAWDHTPRLDLKYSTRIIPLSGEKGEAAVAWSPARRQTSLITPALPRGRYRLEVRAIDLDGNADPVPAGVDFTVLPPLWMRPVFAMPLSAAAMVCAVLLAWIYRGYTRLRRSQGALERAHKALLLEVRDRDLAERALRESEAHLEEAQAIARLGSWKLNLQTSDGTWSRAMFELLGLKESAGAPSLDEFLEFVHPEDRDMLMKTHATIIETGEPGEFEFRGNPAKGPPRYFHARIHPLRNERGAIDHLSGTMQDITPEKRAEQERLSLEHHLRQAQRLESVGRLAGGIAHDFNNILHALMSFCHLAQESKGKEPALLDDCLSGIDLAGQRASELVHQLLAFSRQETAEVSAHDIETIVADSITLLRRTLPATVEICSNTEGEFHRVLAGPGQIHQIVLNLCTNAAYCMEETGGTLRIDVHGQTFSRMTIANTGELRPGPYVCLAVSDTGPGIDREVQDVMFEPFFTTKEVGRGTGLGLATVHGIVHSLGGAIAVDSELGRGTTFRVYLPVCEAEVVEQKAAPEPRIAPSTNGGERHVLLVDDEADIVKVTSTYLGRRGFNVDAFTHPEDALVAFRESPKRYSVVITDMTMPQITGLALAERIRTANAAIPILLISGRIEKSDKDSPHISEVLKKPLSMRKLLEAIERNIST